MIDPNLIERTVKIIFNKDAFISPIYKKEIKEKILNEVKQGDTVYYTLAVAHLTIDAAHLLWKLEREIYENYKFIFVIEKPNAKTKKLVNELISFGFFRVYHHDNDQYALAYNINYFDELYLNDVVYLSTKVDYSEIWENLDETRRLG